MKRNKFGALLLSVIMVVAMVPMTAFGQTYAKVVQVSTWDAFASALKDSTVETISLTKDITSPQGAGDDAVFLEHAVTILGNGNTMSLNAGGLILGGDVTLEKLTLKFNNMVRNAIIANGYTLTLSDVTNADGRTLLHVFAGGITDYNGSNVAELPKAGMHGRVVVEGECQLGNIYAGSLSDGATLETAYANAFDGDVTISFKGSAANSTVGSIYASGARESRGESKPDVFYHDSDRYQVDGSVLIELCSNNVITVDGKTGGKANAEVSFCDADDNMYPKAITLANISKLSVKKGYLELNTDSSLDSKADIALSGGARLSLMKLGEVVSVGAFAGSTAAGSVSELELKTAQTLTVNGQISGQTKVGIGGISFPKLPEAGRTYISAPFSVGLTGEEFAFLDYGGMTGKTPVYVNESNAWIAPKIDNSVVISDISVESKIVESSENIGVSIPIAVSYSKRPDEYTGLAYVPLEITVNEEKTVKDGNETWGYTYSLDDLEIYMQYIEEAGADEYLCIEGAVFKVPEGVYRFVIEVPAENMADGEAESLSFTLVVGEEPVVRKPVAVPAAKTDLVYNGTKQLGVPEGEGYTLTGHWETNAGDYTAVATLKEGYQWLDETLEPKKISWKIQQALGVGSVSLEGWKEGASPNSPMAASKTNDGAVSFVYKLYGADDSTYTDFTVPPTGAGKYTLRATFGSTQNYKEISVHTDFVITHALEYVRAEEAACEKAGNEQHWYCRECDKLYLDAEATQETTAEALEIKALGHAWDSWKELNDEKHKRICKNDASHTETKAHVYTEGVCVCGHKEPATEGVKGFVTRLYQVCLERKPDAEGLEYWEKHLIDGAQTAYGFVFSNEFKEKNYCNEHYIKQLYLAFMGREYEKDGLNYWLDVMKSGATREEVFNGFSQSNEFKNICASYGIEAGEPITVPAYGTVPMGPCSVDGREDGVTVFVKRLYDICLDREADEDGLDYWRERLWNHTVSGAQAAFGFVFSPEFIAKNYDNAAYVEYLYLAFMGRKADEEGKAYWLNHLTVNGFSREDVFYGFVASKEFTDICNSYGIVKNETDDDFSLVE